MYNSQSLFNKNMIKNNLILQILKLLNHLNIILIIILKKTQN
jgi:hypothetical protein